MTAGHQLESSTFFFFGSSAGNRGCPKRLNRRGTEAGGRAVDLPLKFCMADENSFVDENKEFDRISEF